MTLLRVRILIWIGVASLIAYDWRFGIPSRITVAIVLVAIAWMLGDLNARLQKTETESTRRLHELTQKFDRLNKRLRWVEFKSFGADRDDLLSEEWSVRNNAAEYEP